MIDKRIIYEVNYEDVLHQEWLFSVDTQDVVRIASKQLMTSSISTHGDPQEYEDVYSVIIKEKAIAIKDCQFFLLDLTQEQIFEFLAKEKALFGYFKENKEKTQHFCNYNEAFDYFMNIKKQHIKEETKWQNLNSM